MYQSIVCALCSSWTNSYNSIISKLAYVIKSLWSDLIFFQQATSAGLKEQEAINFLEKKMKNDPAFSYEETVQVIDYFLWNICWIDINWGKMHQFEDYSLTDRWFCHLYDKAPQTDSWNLIFKAETYFLIIWNYLLVHINCTKVMVHTLC